jgi:hypothetical protein
VVNLLDLQEVTTLTQLLLVGKHFGNTIEE